MLVTRSGTPGSGKTYHAVQQVLKQIKKDDKLIVITNIPFKLKECADYIKKPVEYVREHIKVYDNDFIIPRLLYSYYIKYPECHFELIIDEADDLFNSRQWNDKSRPFWLQFFRMHRHLHYNVSLLAQGRKTLDKQILYLFDTDYQYRKTSEYGAIGAILWLFLRRLGYCNEVYVPVKAHSRGSFFIFSKKIYNCYDSFTLRNYEGKFFELDEKLMANNYED